ncbi:hypothetical protein [Clostridium manihotivorum]|uniref:Restriction endonuclease type IV Mrr domain-containing protein n=1 Tax=Clostridium manihotivorum TaxID=2320868 RepID=A0A410DYG6_9CLOT|nr:hypothetical protein [Clostridium manihotivorum]QAA34092.1 hypothetical protein C1I91_22050 [Clostridium manihotivorum]
MNSDIDKIKIKEYCNLAYKIRERASGEIIGFVDENVSEILNFDFEENVVWSGNCFDGFFEQINVCRFGNILWVELQKLGDYNGFYKDWAMKKYMSTMYEICNLMDGIYVNNYEYDDEDPMFRAFFISFIFNIDDFKFYEKIFKYCHEYCNNIEKIIERKLKGSYWIPEFEKDEMMFCNMYLTPFFKKIGFEQVIFNHGKNEYGKDYVLVTKNIFGETEYYGVQAKAGDMRGSANSNITEISNQIENAFKIPYKLINGKEVYISKMIIAISGKFTDNAQTIIQKYITTYMLTNTVFLSKKELENHKLMS